MPGGDSPGEGWSWASWSLSLSHPLTDTTSWRPNRGLQPLITYLVGGEGWEGGKGLSEHPVYLFEGALTLRPRRIAERVAQSLSGKSLATGRQITGCCQDQYQEVREETCQFRAGCCFWDIPESTWSQGGLG